MTMLTASHLHNLLNVLQPENRFIGFDTMFDRFEQHTQYHDTNFPVHNVVHNKEEESYTIELALAGYTDDDISIQLEDNVLSIKGDKGEDEQNYISKGIAYRKFEKRWTLGEYMVVDGASFENGLLKVYISKVIPDEKKPRTIKINGKKSEKKSLLKG